jgi:hypothetical protein
MAHPDTDVNIHCGWHLPSYFDGLPFLLDAVEADHERTVQTETRALVPAEAETWKADLGPSEPQLPANRD